MRIAFSAVILILGCAPLRAELPVAALERSEPVLFSKEIAPLLKRSCLACHNTTKAKAKLNLETVPNILKGSADGAVLVPGRADESLLFISAAHRDDPVMPPENNKSNAPNLAPEELALLKLWIDQGAEDDGGGAADTLVNLVRMNDKVNAIYSVALSPDNLYAAAGRGNHVAIYHLPTGRLEAELSDPALSDSGGAAHLDIVGALAFGRGGMLASAGFRNVKLWRRPDVSPRAVFEPLGEAATRAATSSDGKWAVAGDSTGAIKLYSLEDLSAKPKPFKDHAAAIAGLGFAADGRVVSVAQQALKIRPVGGEGEVRSIELPAPVTSLAIVAGGSRAACGCEDGVIRLLALDGEPAIVELKGHATKVTGLAAFGEGAKQLLSGGADGALKVWNLDNPAAPALQANNGSPVVALAASADGLRFASAGEDKLVRLWNGADAKKLGELRTDSHAAALKAAAESAKTIATATRDARKAALDAADKRWVEEREKAKKATEAEAAALAKLAEQIAALEKAEALKRNLDLELASQTAQKHPQLAAAQEAAKKAAEALTKAQAEADNAGRARTAARRNTELAIRFGGRAGETKAQAEATLASAEAKLLAATAAAEAATKAVPEALKAIRALAFSPDSALLLGAAEDGLMYSWGAGSGAAAERIPASGGAITALGFVASGDLFVGGADKQVRLLDPTPAWVLERTIGGVEDSDTFADRVNAVAFSPDGRLLATGGGVPSRSGELKIWRVRDGVAQGANTEDHSDAISAVAFSPDGRRIATAATDRYVKVFFAEDAKLERAFEGHTNHVLDVAWRADGLALASSGADHVVKVWDFEAGTQKQTVSGHSKAVTAVDFVGPGDNLVSSSGDQSVRLGNQPLPEAGTFMHAADASPDGTMIAAGGEDSVLRIWRASDRKMLLKLP